MDAANDKWLVAAAAGELEELAAGEAAGGAAICQPMTSPSTTPIGLRLDLK